MPVEYADRIHSDKRSQPHGIDGHGFFFTKNSKSAKPNRRQGTLPGLAEQKVSWPGTIRFPLHPANRHASHEKPARRNTSSRLAQDDINHGGNCD